jgi:putative transposase
MNAPLPAVSVTATMVDIAQALGVTKQAVAQRANREAWPFEEITLRGGKRRLYPLATLPADVNGR